MKIILASASPRRKEILTDAGYDIEVIPADVEEVTLQKADETVKYNALLKARHIASLYPNRTIVAADTVVSLNNRILGKPKDMKQAVEMLKSLSSKTHEVYTGVAVFVNGEEKNWITTSTVTFKKLNDEDIQKYFSLCNPLDKAGAYNINEHSNIIIEKFEGSYTNIMGLPKEEITEVLNQD